MITSSKVRFMSSIIAKSWPPLTPVTSRGVLSSSVSPIDCASRRAGSMVRTTVRRPASAPSTATAAAVVVLPTPPLPQVTITLVLGSRAIRAMSSPSAGAGAGAAPLPGLGRLIAPLRRSTRRGP